MDKLSKILCGKFRKGHFEGVLNVINRFLEIINPKYIFLGIKDLQQLILIDSHIKKNNINTKVIKCKTIREKNGVACSTRNLNLNNKVIIIILSILMSSRADSKIKLYSKVEVSPRLTTTLGQPASTAAAAGRDLQKDFCSLLNLQIITEKLLYQLDTPVEIAEKFQVLKQGTYDAIGLSNDNPFTSIESVFKEQ